MSNNDIHEDDPYNLANRFRGFLPVVVDVETGEEIDVYAKNVQEKYTELVTDYFKGLKNKCLQYKIDYLPVNIHDGFHQVLTSCLVSRKN